MDPGQPLGLGYLPWPRRWKRALTCQDEEGTPRDGYPAFGSGVAVSDPCTLHAHDAEDHGHKAQEYGHHHQGSC